MQDNPQDNHTTRQLQAKQAQAKHKTTTRQPQDSHKTTTRQLQDSTTQHKGTHGKTRQETTR